VENKCFYFNDCHSSFPYRSNKRIDFDRDRVKKLGVHEYINIFT